MLGDWLLSAVSEYPSSTQLPNCLLAEDFATITQLLSCPRTSLSSWGLLILHYPSARLAPFSTGEFLQVLHFGDGWWPAMFSSPRGVFLFSRVCHHIGSFSPSLFFVLCSLVRTYTPWVKGICWKIVSASWMLAAGLPSWDAKSRDLTTLFP